MKTLPSQLIQIHNRPVHDSFIGEGFLLQQCLTIPSQKLNFSKKPKFSDVKIVLLNNKDDGLSENVLKVQLIGSESRHIKYFCDDRQASNVVEELVKAGLDLVICQYGVKPRLKQALVEAGESQFKVTMTNYFLFSKRCGFLQKHHS